MKTVEQLAQSTNPALVRAFGAIRRLVVTLTDTAIWQIAGVLMPDGREAMRAEVFSGVGFYARPPAGAEVDAIVVMGGDATNPAIVGLRDEKTRAAVVGGMKPDEAALYNTLGLVYVKDDGTIEARSKNGTAKRLATKDDIDALASWIHLTMVVNATGATAGTTTVPPSAAGTSKLKGE